MLSTILNGVIRFALQNRMLVAAFATFLLLFGGWQMTQLPIDVFPDLNRPRVVIMTEAHGLAPEEVETLVSIPIETALNGATGVQDVRSTSGVGLSVIYVEFDWGTDIYDDRQVVAERLAVVVEQLPEGVEPQLSPISSIMGQIVMVGMLSHANDKTFLFEVGDLGPNSIATLNSGRVPQALLAAFESLESTRAGQLEVKTESRDKKWMIGDRENGLWYNVVRASGSATGVSVHRRTSPMEMRTMADWVVRQQLLKLPGVSQVFVMGGERKQFQVLVDPNLMLKYGVTLHQVEAAVAASNSNATGGYLDEQGPNELLVRALGRVKTLDDVAGIVVTQRGGKSVLLGQVARVVAGAQIKRGDSAVYLRSKGSADETPTTEGANDGPFTGGPGIILTITKQPGADTTKVTELIEETIKGLEARLVDSNGRVANDIRLDSEIYQQKIFIDHAIANVKEALRDGAGLVVLILFLFLLNFRTTFITLTAIPLSLVMTALVFHVFGLSINTMTLGGLAVAIGELVDDAIVDVENVFRRLKENRNAGSPKNPLLVVFQASVEVRNSIVFGTMIVILVFLPLFALGGMEGRLFAPLGVAYIVSILASLLVSLTVTPVLSYWLLARKKKRSGGEQLEKDSFLLRFLKWIAGGAIRSSLRFPIPILGIASIFVAIAALALYSTERDFLPPFNEGSVQINVLMPPGTSLRKSTEVAEIAAQRIQEVPEIQTLARRTGRAELDEHAEGVNVTEFFASLKDAEKKRSREVILDDIRGRLEEVPGIVVSVEQPLAHLISHMISGVKAQVGIKLFGDDLETLRRTAKKIEMAIKTVEGVTDAQVEQQTEIPQLQISIDGDRLQQFGLRRTDVTEFIETAMNGHVVSEVLEDQRKFDLLIRLDERYREDLITLGRLTIDLPDGGATKLEDIATLRTASGPNQIKREQVLRRIVIQCNVSGRGLVDVVEDIKKVVRPIEAQLPAEYFLEYGGQFESQQSASRVIAILFVVSLVGMLLVLYTMFKSFNLALQVMVALPMAFIGSVAALRLTDQTLTIAAMVGFISLCGIASRNGILLINHYLHLVKYEGESWSREMIVRAGKERLAPVLMTCLTTGIGLIPLAIAAGETGKEILYPVATVIIGGLITSTALEFLVRPALFWQFGMGSAKAVCDNTENAVKLIEESEEEKITRDTGPQIEPTAI